MVSGAELKAGVDPVRAAAVFDALEPVTAEQILGRWHGSEVPTGHPLDGLLDVSGWYGKEFVDTETVHPLLFGRPGALWAVNPKLMPLGLLNRLGTRFPRWLPPGGTALFRLAATGSPRARLREVEFRGRVGAAMVYDDLPIIDHFRRLDDDALLGAMDLRGSRSPYFFLLERD
ncbi:MAG: DUF4334 domain-containing protein [Gordonia sp. (in: high G+C Gram-positive bacteria)]|uniref:DUF4334 domain-containing protein n=1 Tax=Gordonia sp. (in: high G+C Gram-positive bacteria) TaxID=84139 RepID=UPI0039E44E20